MKMMSLAPLIRSSGRRWGVLLAAVFLILICMNISYQLQIGYNITKLSGLALAQFGNQELISRSKNEFRIMNNATTPRGTVGKEMTSTISLRDENSITFSRTPYLHSTIVSTVLPGLISMDAVVNLQPTLVTKPDEKEPLLIYSQRRDYDSLIRHENECKPLSNAESEVSDEDPMNLNNTADFDYENEIFLLMSIKSMCASKQRRDAVRRTWGNETWSRKNLGVRIEVFFLLGACENQEMQSKVVAEDKISSDILQWDFFDSFRNLTLKDCLFLQWYSRNCRRVPYIYKGDDDVFVNTGNIIKYLAELAPDKRSDLFVGSLLVNSPRIVNPKWKYFVSSNLYPGKFYPPYVSGGGFLMSGHLATRLFVASLKTRIIPIDDAYVGILLKSIGVIPKNDHGFKSWGMKKRDTCRIAKVKTFHKVTPEEMITIWKEVNEIDLQKCEKETDDVLHSHNK